MCFLFLINLLPAFVGAAPLSRFDVLLFVLTISLQISLLNVQC